jgi:hypothetical protein
MSAKTFDVDTDIPGQLQAVENSTRRIEMSSEIEKRAMAKSLQDLVKYRLFGEGEWVVEDDELTVINKIFTGMGLLKPEYPGDDPNCPDRFSCMEATPFGKECDVDLILFMAGIIGIWDECLYELHKAELIEEFECDIVYRLWSAYEDPEAMLRVMAMRGYYKYYNIAPGSDEDPLKRPPVEAATPIDAVDAPPLH